MTTNNDIATAIRETLTSPNEADRNLEPANTVDGLFEISRAVRHAARAIASDGAPGHDETGGYVDSLTEALMGVTAGLCRIAESIQNLADAVRESQEEGVS